MNTLLDYVSLWYTLGACMLWIFRWEMRYYYYYHITEKEYVEDIVEDMLRILWRICGGYCGGYVGDMWGIREHAFRFARTWIALLCCTVPTYGEIRNVCTSHEHKYKINEYVENILKLIET